MLIFFSVNEKNDITLKYPDKEAPMPDSVPMIRMSDVQQTAVHWLWYPYVPFGKLTIEEKIFSMYAKGMTPYGGK